MLFENGYRGNNAKTLGSGIGLSYAKVLADEMNSALDIEIENYSNNCDIFKVKIEIKDII